MEKRSNVKARSIGKKVRKHQEKVSILGEGDYQNKRSTRKRNMKNHYEAQLEHGLKHDFINEIREIPGGEQIDECIQCGMCSASCPTSFLMIHTPRRLIAMTRAGMRKEVLSSPDIWLCTSCYFCSVRCPKQIKVTDLMYAYKRLSSREKSPIQKRGYHLGNIFLNIVNKYGRNNETELIFRYFLRADPIGFIKNMSIGLKLFIKGRMSLKRHKIKDIKTFRKIVHKAEILQRTP